MKLYLKLFFGTGILFGLLMGILLSFLHGILGGLVSGLFSGVIFGLFISLSLGTIHKIFFKRIQTKDTNASEGVHQMRSIKMNLSFDAAFDACIKSISRIKKCNILKEDRINGEIDAKAGMTWKTFGDKINFTITKMDKDNTKIEISSKPAIFTTLVDYGKNLENVQTIEAFLNNQKTS